MGLFSRAKGYYDSKTGAERGTPESEYTPWLRLAFTLVVMNEAEENGFVNAKGDARVASFADAHRYIAEHSDVRERVYQAMYETVCGELDSKCIPDLVMAYAEAVT